MPVEHEELLLEFSVKQWLVVLQVGEVLLEVEELSSDADAREGLANTKLISDYNLLEDWMWTGVARWKSGNVD